MNDPINHPAHYTSHSSGVECIQLTEHMNFNLGNALKYLWRAGLKDATARDLGKAEWYVTREIQLIERYNRSWRGKLRRWLNARKPATNEQRTAIERYMPSLDWGHVDTAIMLIIRYSDDVRALESAAGHISDARYAAIVDE